MALTQVSSKGIKDATLLNEDVNASAAIAMSKLALSITNSEINASAAIAKSKLASLNIVNADVNSSAAIAKEKLEDFVTGNSNNRLLTATGNTNSLTGESSFTYDGNGMVDIEGTGAAAIQIKTPDSTDGGVYFRTGTTNAGAISYLHNSTLADGVMNFRSGGTTKMVIKGNGRVGINSTNPAGKFHISDTYHFLVTGGNSTTGMKIGNYDGSSYGVLTTRASELRFDIGDNNKMKIDSSGNILCVANGAQSSLAPFFISVIGKNAINYGGDTNDTACLRIEDKGTNNNYYHGIELRTKRGGDVRMYAHDQGDDTADLVFALDGGVSPAEKIRILNTGGITFNGDTAAANALSDYEEGTFTATCDNGVTLHSSQDLCRYTRIGRLVTVNGQVRINDDNNGADFAITNLPFNNADENDGASSTVGAVRLWDFNIPSDTVNIVALVDGSDDNIDFWVNRDNTGADRLNADSNAYVAFTVTYTTS
ncbi:hypothetical protein PRRG_00022 [Prochlorococcus phage P-RSP2]|nr:hypothetical protein PRRG_00022 [Prochlorococcus phage P-RSP2]